MALYGVDVYDGQGSPDWAAVKAAGWSFAIIKATQGTRNVQDTFESNRSETAAAGMGPIGLYHFAQNGDPVAQADHFCDVVGALRSDEFAVLDIEGNEQYFTLPLGQWPGFIMAFCERVESRIGGPVAVYISESPAEGMPADCAMYPLWVAGYVTNQPAEWEDWRVGPWERPAIWQYSSNGVVPGIGGRCDVNIAPDDLRSRLGLGTTQGDDDVALRPDTENAIVAVAESLHNLLVGFSSNGDRNQGSKELGEALKALLKR